MKPTSSAQTSAVKKMSVKKRGPHFFTAHFLPAFLFALHLFASLASAGSLQLTNDPSTGSPGKFAAAEIQRAADAKDTTAKITLTVEKKPIATAQSYRIERAGDQIRVIGADEAGAMYGGLEVEEAIRIGTLDSLKSSENKPHVARRGLKFNIPLDIRNPSYQDAGDAAQANIAEMWNFEFWREFLDSMARHRYNSLGLWNPHPFPSMVKLADYPEAALRDVCGTAFPLDTDRTEESEAKFIAGSGVSQPVLDNLIVLKSMTIDEKIDFWRRVMRHAKDRSIEVHFVTWNIWMNSLAPAGWYRQQQNLKGDAGLYGVNNDQTNPRTIAYLRACVREFILTYPDLAGIGFTPGENMEDRDDEFGREKWLWATYGEGILDAKKLQPGRSIEVYHRVWEAGIDRIMDSFVRRYPDPINLSYKYTRARLHSTPTPHWAEEEIIPDLKKHGIKSWWNLRNDDLFHFRWADPAYVSAFMKNLPGPDLTAGYDMGSDSYTWGREFISTRPNHPRDLEIHKHWFNFLLWGRLGYEPDLPPARLTAIVQNHFPDVPAQPLLDAWTSASRTIALVNQFHWIDWDFKWAVEGCLELRKGFKSVDDFISTKTMPGSGLFSIPEYVAARLGNPKKGLTPPTAVANRLEADASASLAYVRSIRAARRPIAKELSELLYDIESFAHLANYYASKIRGATHLHEFRTTGVPSEQAAAISTLESGLAHWKAYAASATANYRPQFLSKTRTIDWVRLTDDARRDIDIARAATGK